MQNIAFPHLLLLVVALLPPTILSMNKKPPPEIKEYPGFGRECISGESCKFTTGNGTLYFICKPSTADKAKLSFCFCGTGSPPSDELMFPLEWDRDAERCLVGPGGPCGTDRGLSVHCRDVGKSETLECVEGRCRNPENLHSGDVSAFCGDDLDCKNGLECRESETPAVIKIKRCYHHRSE